MALLFMDGFDYYISGEDMVTKWDNTYSVSEEDTKLEGRRGGRCFKIDYNGHMYIKFFNEEDQTLVFGGAMKIDSYEFDSYGSSFLVGFNNTYEGSASTFYEIILRVEGSTLIGRKKVSGSSYTTIGQSATGSIKLNTWHYIEIKCRIHGTSGVFILRIDDKEAFNYSGETFYSGTEVTCVLGIKGRKSSDVDYTWWDDMYVLTDSGEAPTDFLGDCMVDTIYPSASGEYTEMAPSSGENWECVNETILDDTDYVTGGLGEKENYDYQDVSGESTIHGIQLIDVHAISEGSIIYKKPLLSIYGNDYSGEEVPAAGVKNINATQFGLDPESGEAWTSDKINKYEFGVKLVE